MEYACLPGYIFKLGRACETGSNAHAFVGNAWDTPRLIPLFVRSWPDTFPVWSSFIKDRDSCLQCVRLFVLPALCEPWEGLSKVEGFVIVIKVIICRPSAHDFILIPTFRSCNTPTAATLLTSLGLCYPLNWWRVQCKFRAQSPDLYVRGWARRFLMWLLPSRWLPDFMADRLRDGTAVISFTKVASCSLAIVVKC